MLRLALLLKMLLGGGEKHVWSDLSDGLLGCLGEEVDWGTWSRTLQRCWLGKFEGRRIQKLVFKC
jgi:hypothetical protein